MPGATSIRPHVNGILATSLYVEHPTRAVEFYRRAFGFESIDADEKEDRPDAALRHACR